MIYPVDLFYFFETRGTLIENGELIHFGEFFFFRVWAFNSNTLSYKGVHVESSKNIFIIGFPFRTIEIIKDKNENLEVSIDTLEKSNSVLHQSNNNLQQERDP